MRGDHHVLDQRQRLRLRDAAHFLEHAALADRQHHHPRGAPLAGRRLGQLAQRMAQHQLFQRDADAEPQRAAAKTADAARPDLEDPRT